MRIPNICVHESHCQEVFSDGLFTKQYYDILPKKRPNISLLNHAISCQGQTMYSCSNSQATFYVWSNTVPTLILQVLGIVRGVNLLVDVLVLAPNDGLPKDGSPSLPS